MKLWILSKLCFWKCEFCQKKRLWRCEFCQKLVFEIVNFVKKNLLQKSLDINLSTLKCCSIRSGSVSGATLPMKMRESCPSVLSIISFVVCDLTLFYLLFVFFVSMNWTKKIIFCLLGIKTIQSDRPEQRYNPPFNRYYIKYTSNLTKKWLSLLKILSIFKAQKTWKSFNFRYVWKMIFLSK